MRFEAIYQFQSPIGLAVQPRASVEGNAHEREQGQLVPELRSQKTANARRNVSLGSLSWRRLHVCKICEQ
jgi:hypothetical protein